MGQRANLPPVGSTASELVRTFPTLMPEVAAFSFSWYQTRPSMLDEVSELAESGAAPGVNRYRPSRSRERNQLGWLDIAAKPFPEHTFEKLVGLVMRHQSTQTPLDMPSDRVRAGDFLHTRPLGAGPNVVVAFDSRCKSSSGDYLHLPMLDFRCEPEDYFVKLLVLALRRMVTGGGALLFSGRSFHFYGFKPLDEAGWRRFMSYALLLSPLTDFRYVGHRLLDGFASLRLTTSTLKPDEPAIVAYLDE